MPSKDYFTVLKDGQLAVATVAQTGDIIPEEGKDPTQYTTALVQTADGPQLCQKTYSVGGGGGGGGGDTAWGDITGTLSNQTDLKTALDAKLQNTATGTNALTILGSVGANKESVNIGKSSSSSTQRNVAVGTYAICKGNNVSSDGVAPGASATAIGYYAEAETGTALGSCTEATKGVAIGRGKLNTSKVIASKEGSIAIGVVYGSGSAGSVKATAIDAIQLGAGVNNTQKQFQVYEYPMLDGTTGKIPADRMPDTLLQNTATGNNSLTIDGTATTKKFCVNIGKNAECAADSSVAIGANSTAAGGTSVAIGSNASVTSGLGVAIGGSVNSAEVGTVAIGYAIFTINSTYGVSVGYGTELSAANDGVAIGHTAKSKAQSAIQLGTGVNTTANTLQVYTYPLLDGTTGLIPLERLGTGYDATKTQVLKHINGVATWVDEA